MRRRHRLHAKDGRARHRPAGRWYLPALSGRAGRRLLALSAVAALVLTPLLQTSPASATGLAAGYPGSHAGSAPRTGQPLTAAAVMHAQIPLIRAADQIVKAAAAGESGYANIVLSVARHLVLVYWKGAVPGPIARLLGRLRSSAVRIEVRPAPYTTRQLAAEVQRLEASRSGYAARGVLLDSIAVRVDGTGIEIGTDIRAGFHPVVPGVLASLQAGTQIPLSIQPARKVNPTHRLEDLPLHWAGSRIINVQGTDSCTTGFPMQRRSDGRTFITTADHCDSDLGHPVNEQWWDWFGTHDINHRMGEAWYHTAYLDIAYIRPPNGWVQGVTYDGGVAENHDFSKNVVGVASNYDGGYVCTSGSWTGVHCSIQTQYQGSFWISEDNSYVSEWVGDQTGGGIADGEGDSGGPVFSLGSQSGTVIAKGSLSLGFGNGFNCVNDNGESTVCFTQIGWVDEESILTALGATILTT